MTEKQEMIELGLKIDRTLEEEKKLSQYIHKEARRRYFKMVLRDKVNSRKKK